MYTVDKTKEVSSEDSKIFKFDVSKDATVYIAIKGSRKLRHMFAKFKMLNRMGLLLSQYMVFHQ